MRLKIKWNFNNAVESLGANCCVVSDFEIKNGKGIGEIHISHKDLNLSREDLEGEIINISGVIMSAEIDEAINIEEENEEQEISPEDPSDLEDLSEQFSSLILSGGKTSKPKTPVVKTNKPVQQKQVKAEIEELEVKPKENSFTKISHIKDVNTLYDYINKACEKSSNIDPDKIQNIREKMLAVEQKARQESIDVPCWVVNRKYASLSVNDMDIGFSINSPVDLSRYSAKKLIVSRDLKSLLSSKYVEFISPQEAKEIFDANNSTTIDFSELGKSHDRRSAERTMFQDSANDIASDMDLSDMTEDNGSVNLTPMNNGPKNINGKKQGQLQPKKAPTTDGSAPMNFKPLRKMSDM